MAFVLDHQLALLFACFVAGCIGVAMIFRRPAGSKAWRLADLLWVVLGGIGGVTAVLAGIYKSDSSLLDRQIDIAYALTDAFDRDAARFRLRYCETGSDADLRILCDKVEFLSASTAGNADLPLFLAITESSGTLRALPLFSNQTVPDRMSDTDAFGEAAFLAFVALDDTTRPALASLRTEQPEIAADFQILASTYDELIAQIRRLIAEWEFLRASAAILVLQTLALCLVSFAAPFRLGKSVAELR
ncbi:hypothetical protein [Sedimentitalea todarodis]|uniref:DUF4239 domain-containing protein n=1 Tax=Sedimentitalea todarodis TaxID=1631240 RepID=A0ABU3VFQ2_9RHOB|nr:hypothetical protein [Sedimentitalea todarodis]MDU9004918.1 hypothetical protein [Sedimentitalea todarodis]